MVNIYIFHFALSFTSVEPIAVIFSVKLSVCVVPVISLVFNQVNEFTKLKVIPTDTVVASEACHSCTWFHTRPLEAHVFILVVFSAFWVFLWHSGRTLSLTSKLSLSCALPAADG